MYPPRSILFHGPPGTGKTSLAQAVAQELEWEFVKKSATGFSTSHVGEGAQNVRKFFEQARAESPCVLFIDEIDLLGSRSDENTSKEDVKTLGELWQAIDDLLKDRTCECIIIAATNFKHKLDATLSRRFTEHLDVFLPDAFGRSAIIKHYL